MCDSDAGLDSVSAAQATARLAEVLFPLTLCYLSTVSSFAGSLTAPAEPCSRLFLRFACLCLLTGVEHDAGQGNMEQRVSEKREEGEKRENQISVFSLSVLSCSRSDLLEPFFSVSGQT